MTRGPIVGVGHILTFNLVLRFGDLLPIHAPIARYIQLTDSRRYFLQSGIFFNASFASASVL